MCIVSCALKPMHLRLHSSDSPSRTSKTSPRLSVSRAAEEVYACEFLEAREGALCTASGDSLFQWDLAAAALVQESGPPAVPGDKRAGALCSC